MTDSASGPELGDLLAEEDFVRRLARGLLFDEHRVDDVVQQTWLAALTHPPKAVSRSWLQRVVRNLALNQIRGEDRRRRREAEAARAEELPSVSEVLDREALRRQVVQAMLDLPEPYRGTLLLRYFEDRSPKQIARRLAVPGGTVRARLKRGLDLLRQRLDHACGDRHRWALGLIGLARAGRAARGALMPVLLGMAGGLLLVAAGVWMLNPEDVLPPSASPVLGSSATETSGEVASAASPPRPDPGTGARRPVASRSSALALSGFRGRLLTASGVPATDEVVRIFGVDGLTVFLEGPRNRIIGSEARTGTDGRFLVEGLRPGALYLMHAGAGGAHATLHTVSSTPAPGEIADLGDVQLEARGDIEGRVVDPDDRAIPGAEVWAADLPAVILAAVPIDRFSPDNGAILWLPTPSATELQGNGDYPARLEKFLGADMLRKAGLEDRADTAALVVDAPAWVHRLYGWLPVSRSRTAADGTFRLMGVVPGSNVLVVRHPGFATGRRQVMVRAGRTRDAGTTRLRAGETALGSVTDSRGRPIVKAEVRVAAVGAPGLLGLVFCGPAVTTDSEGRFEVRGLPRGEMLVAVRRDGAMPWTLRGPLSVDEEIVVALPDSEALLVELEEVGPFADVELTLFEGPSLAELRHAGLQRRLPLEGRLHRLSGHRYRIDDLLPGTYALRIVARGHAPEEVVFLIPRSTPLQVGLRPAAPFVVRVHDAQGAAVSGARIFARETSPPPWARSILPTSYGLPGWNSLPHAAGITDETGAMRLDVLPEGQALVGAFHPDLGQIDATVTLPTAEVALVLPGSGGIGGRLFDQGRPADPKTWKLSFTYADAAGNAMPRSPAFAVIGPEGRYHIEGLSAGTYVVEPQHTDGVTSLSGLVGLLEEKIFPYAFDFGSKPVSKRTEVRAEEMAELRFDLDPSWPEPGSPGGTITGVVRLDGEPGAGLEVCRDDLLDPARLTTTDSSGAFRLEGLAAGRLRLCVREPGREAALWLRRVEVEVGKTRHLEVAIRTGTLEGHAFAADGRPASGLRAVALGSIDGGITRFETGTDRSGGFRFPRLPSGRYEVLIEGTGLRGTSEEVAVTAGSHPRVSVRLVDLVSVEGHVRGDKPAAMVTLGSEETGLMESGAVAEDGAFRIEGLEPGVYLITVMAPDYTMWEPIEKQVTVLESGLRGLEIR